MIKSILAVFLSGTLFTACVTIQVIENQVENDPVSPPPSVIVPSPPPIIILPPQPVPPHPSPIKSKPVTRPVKGDRGNHQKRPTAPIMPVRPKGRREPSKSSSKLSTKQALSSTPPTYGGAKDAPKRTRISFPSTKKN